MPTFNALHWATYHQTFFSRQRFSHTSRFSIDMWWIEGPYKDDRVCTLALSIALQKLLNETPLQFNEIAAVCLLHFLMHDRGFFRFEERSFSCVLMTLRSWIGTKKHWKRYRCTDSILRNSQTRNWNGWWPAVGIMVCESSLARSPLQVCMTRLSLCTIPTIWVGKGAYADCHWNGRFLLGNETKNTKDERRPEEHPARIQTTLIFLFGCMFGHIVIFLQNRNLCT